jgi:hypothetical protein
VRLAVTGDSLIFPLYSTSPFKFDNPSPQGIYKGLANNKNPYGGIRKARSSYTSVGWLSESLK